MSRTGVDIENQDGITLIELVVSVGMIGIIMVSVFFLYDVGAKSFGFQGDQLYLQQNARQGMMCLSTNIRQSKRVEIISEDKIKIVMYSDETMTFYLKDNILYRQKNTGVNAIAELSQLKFFQPAGKNYVEIMLGTEKNNHTLNIKTKVTPMGNIQPDEEQF